MGKIEIKNLKKIYGKADYKTLALENINLSIEKGELVAIIGASGSGKSTLLNIIGCIDNQTEGDYFLDNVNVKELKNKDLSKLRGSKVSFIYQDFALLKDFTVYENIELPLIYSKLSSKECKEKIRYYLKKLGIGELENKKAKHLSGGQMQRVAIARALVSESEIILADEPTGALDKKTGEDIINILLDINREGKTVIIVTHDEKIANRCTRKIEIQDGKIIKDIVENFIK